MKDYSVFKETSSIGYFNSLTNSLSPKDTHGPLIKTGARAGQNRSRNQNGQWRKKRSDAGKPRVRSLLDFLDF